MHVTMNMISILRRIKWAKGQNRKRLLFMHFLISVCNIQLSNRPGEIIYQGQEIPLIKVIKVISCATTLNCGSIKDSR